MKIYFPALAFASLLALSIMSACSDDELGGPSIKGDTTADAGEDSATPDGDLPDVNVEDDGGNDTSPPTNAVDSGGTCASLGGQCVALASCGGNVASSVSCPNTGDVCCLTCASRGGTCTTGECATGKAKNLSYFCGSGSCCL